MRTKLVTTLVFLCMMSSFTMELVAQEAIKALVKKCENMEDVNFSIVRNRDSKTKKVTKDITSVSIQNNPALVEEFVNAFAKESKNADQEIENRKNGNTNLFYRFGNTSYSFTESKNGCASISIIEKNDE